MFDDTIRGLHRQGFTSGAIGIRLGLSPEYVRHVLSAPQDVEVSGAAKPHYNAVAAEDLHLHQAAVSATKKSDRQESGSGPTCCVGGQTREGSDGSRCGCGRTG